MDVDDVGRVALALPRTSEEPHHRRSSFRVDGKAFLAVPPDGEAVHIVVGEHEARAAVARSPGRAGLLWWGKALSGVRVHLADDEAALAALVTELVEAAWRRKAPRRLVAEHDAPPP